MSKSGSISTSISGGIDIGLVGSASQPVTLDAGLSDIGVTVNGIPGKPLGVDLGLTATGDPNKPIALDLALQATGDKTKPIALDLGLNVHVDELDIKLEPLTIDLKPLEIKLDPVKVDLGLDNINVCLSLAFTQFPRMQLHMPKKYNFGFSLFGLPLIGFSVCGESSFITEDNPPRLFQKGRPDAARAEGFPYPAEVVREAPYRVILSE